MSIKNQVKINQKFSSMAAALFVDPIGARIPSNASYYAPLKVEKQRACRNLFGCASRESMEKINLTMEKENREQLSKYVVEATIHEERKKNSGAIVDDAIDRLDQNSKCNAGETVFSRPSAAMPERRENSSEEEERESTEVGIILSANIKRTTTTTSIPQNTNFNYNNNNNNTNECTPSKRSKPNSESDQPRIDECFLNKKQGKICCMPRSKYDNTGQPCINESLERPPMQLILSSIQHLPSPPIRPIVTMTPQQQQQQPSDDMKETKSTPNNVKN